tara:strand:+ start:3071 stop:3967 length:897 start_codon:yes stop_codon:yes gene_type:complete
MNFSNILPSNINNVGSTNSFGKSNNRVFSNNKYLNKTTQFLESNNVITKFSFIVLSLIIFLTLLRLGFSTISWLLSPSSNPILIKGMVNAKQMVIIPQDPSVNGSKPILRSDDDDEGIEFTWSVWLYNDDFSYKRDEYKHVFHKGNDNINTTTKPYGKNDPNNSPGLYIAPNTNDLVVVMNTFGKMSEEVVVKGIPMDKWFNVIIRLNRQRNLDVYINGTMAKRHRLSSIPKQNYGNVYTSMNGGFSGYISDLRYFNNALGTTQIQNIISKGPSLITSYKDGTKTNKPSYLSQSWFFS